MVVVSLASGFPISVVIMAFGTAVVATKVRGKIFFSLLIFGIISQMVVMEWILYKFWVAVNKVLTIIYKVACSLVKRWKSIALDTNLLPGSELLQL